MARGVYAQAEGIRAESIAANYLRQRGYRIVARNYAVPKVGELDIVAYQGEALVIVEVKYRRDAEYGEAVEQLTKAKARKIIAATAAFLRQESPSFSELRYDLIQVTDLGVTHIPNAFYGTFF